MRLTTGPSPTFDNHITPFQHKYYSATARMLYVCYNYAMDKQQSLVRINTALKTALKNHSIKEGRTLEWTLNSVLTKYLNHVTPATKEPPAPPLGVYEFVPRSKGDVLAEIRNLEAKRGEELEYCQDAEVAKDIHARYAAQIQPLWDEYNL